LGRAIGLTRACGLLALLVLVASDTVVFYEGALPTTLNPLFSRSMVDRRAQELIFDRLFHRSTFTGEVRSRLVDVAAILDDGAGVRLVVRNGIRWHDGERLTADDLCFTVDALLDRETPSQMARPYREVLLGCIVEDRKTAVIRFTRPVHNPEEQLGFPIIPRHKFDSARIQPDDAFAVRPVGTGPMRGRKGRSEVFFDANHNAHHEPGVAALRLAEGGDPLVQVRTLLNGGVQGLIAVSPALRSDVMTSDDVALKSYDLRSWWYIAIDTDHPILRHVEVRNALDAALDRLQLRELTLGYDPEDPVQPCEFISGPFVPSSPYYDRGVPVRLRSDLAAVREQMSAVGAEQRHGSWVVDGEPLTLRVGMHAPLDLEARDLLNLVGNQLQAAGFDRRVFKVSDDDWSTAAVSGDLKGKYDLLIGKWSFGVVENVGPLFETRTATRGAYNLFDYSDPEVDRLVRSWEDARTIGQAQEAYQSLHARLAADRPYLFLWKLDTKSAWRNEVTGATVTPYWYFTDFDGWGFNPDD
jgi:peptide/nickel transport system substrate-binding protein